MQDPYSDNAKQFGPFDENSSTRIERLLRDAKNAAALRHALAMIDIEGAHRLTCRPPRRVCESGRTGFSTLIL